MSRSPTGLAGASGVDAVAPPRISTTTPSSPIDKPAVRSGVSRSLVSEGDCQQGGEQHLADDQKCRVGCCGQADTPVAEQSVEADTKCSEHGQFCGVWTGRQPFRWAARK